MSAGDAAAAELARYLTSTPDYGSKSPLTTEIQAQLRRMAADIAAQVIAGTPELEARVRELTAAAVQDALADDEFLRGTVTAAVARALVTRMREAGEPE